MDLLGCEYSVAGSILISPSCLPLVSARLKPSDFALSSARAVFETALELSSEEGQIDAVTVQARALKNGITLSNAFLAELMNATPTAANVEAYIELVRESSIKRRLMELLNDAEDRTANGESIENLIFELSGAFSTFYSALSSNRLFNSAKVFSDWAKEKQKSSESDSRPVLKTGFHELDFVLGGGMVKGGLYIVGGRPGIGKTTFALSLAMNIIRANRSVLFVSLEMDETQIASKLIAMSTLLSYSEVYQGEMEEPESKTAFDAASSLSGLPFYLSARTHITVPEIVTLARGIEGLGAIIVDYIGLLSPPRGRVAGRYELMTEISGSLKRAASILKVPIICAAQLNREMSGRKSKKPLLTDLRDSGSIEQDADGVILIHRPSYYESEEAPLRCGGPEIFELIVAKNRHGATGSCEMLFNASAGRIYSRKAIGGTYI